MGLPPNQNCPDNPQPADFVSDIMKGKSLSELKSSIIAFLDFINANKRRKNKMCRMLVQSVIEFSTAYFGALLDSERNIIIVPPDISPAIMISTCVPITDNTDSVVAGLNKFLERCDEFSEPVEDMITVEEMHTVLDSAQKRFGLLDIIAPGKPLKIVCLNNSHHIYNCECGLGESVTERESVIFVYRPGNVSVFDRVFIFAHELGHGLHYSLTGDVGIIPAGFDALIESFGIKGLTIHQKQEVFADATAFAILSDASLIHHIPTQIPEHLVPHFAEYIKRITDEYNDVPF